MSAEVYQNNPVHDVDVPQEATAYVKKLLRRFGYSWSELDYLGDEEVALMAPVGNPHQRAACDIGEVVVDIGSGHGADSILAGQAVGHTGKVIGVDLCLSDVEKAIEHSKERGMEWVEFKTGNVPEHLPIEDGLADVVISNGGLDLAPNHSEALKEVSRVLRPGGRLSMSCTVREEELDQSKSWPPSVRALLRKDRLEHLMKSTGFDKILVEDLNDTETLLSSHWGDEDVPSLEARVRYLLPDEGSENETNNTNSESMQEAQRLLTLARATHRECIRQPQNFSISGEIDKVCRRVNVSAVKPNCSGYVGDIENINAKTSLPFQAGFMMLGFVMAGCLTFGPIFLRKKPKWKRGEYGKDLFKKTR